MDSPETLYARSGDVWIAYQAFGEGRVDLVFAPGFVSNIELGWSIPGRAEFLEALASFTRVVQFDKRGTGMSDPVREHASLEMRMDDVRAVMDAARSERALLLGVDTGGMMSIVFAATYPERTSGLLLTGTAARSLWLRTTHGARRRPSIFDRLTRRNATGAARSTGSRPFGVTRRASATSPRRPGLPTYARARAQGPTPPTGG